MGGKKSGAAAPAAGWSSQSKAAGLVLVAFLVGKYQQTVSNALVEYFQTRMKPAISGAWAMAVQHSDYMQLAFALLVGVIPPLWILTSRAAAWKSASPDAASASASEDSTKPSDAAAGQKLAASAAAPASAHSPPAAKAATPSKAAAAAPAAKDAALSKAASAAPAAKVETPSKAAAGTPAAQDDQRAASAAQVRTPPVGRPKTVEELEERKKRADILRKELENDEDQREIRREIRLSEQRRRRALEDDAPRSEEAPAPPPADGGAGDAAAPHAQPAKRTVANDDDEEDEEEKVHYLFEQDDSSRTIEVQGCPNLRVKTSRTVKFLTKSCIFEACYCTKERNPDLSVEWALLWDEAGQKAYCKHLFHASCLIKGIKLWPPNSTGNPCPLCTCLKLFM